MGVLDIAASAIFSFKGDTSDLKAQIKSLQGAERELAEQQLAAAEARNKQFDDWKKSLDSIQSTFGQLKQVGDTLWDGFKSKQKEVRLETAAWGVDVDKLSAAFGGLKTRMEVLEFAARANHSAFALTNEQLQVAAAAARRLEEDGYNGAEALNAITTALTTGRTRGLEPYGIMMHGTGETVTMVGDKMTSFTKKLENSREAFSQLKEFAAGAGKGMGAFGEDADRAAVQFKDAWEEVKQSLSSLALSMAPLATSLRDSFESIKGIAQWVNKLPGVGGSGGDSGSDPSAWDKIKKYGYGYNPVLNPVGFTKGAIGGANDLVTGSISWNNVFHDHVDGGLAAAGYTPINARDFAIVAGQIANLAIDSASEQIEAFYTHTADGLKQIDEEHKRKAKQDAEHALELARKQAEAWREFFGGLAASVESPSALGLAGRDLAGFTTGLTGIVNENAGQGFGAAAQNAQTNAWLQLLGEEASGNRGGIGAAAEKVSKPKDSALAKIFGPVGEFELYKKAFEGLTSASTQAFNAWISGSESAGKAFKQGVSQIVEALADQMLVEGLKYEAYALGALFTDPAAASGYAAAGAAFLGGAALAGGLAHELGAGSSMGGGASAPGGGLPSGVAAPVHGAGPNNVTVVIGNSFAEESPRMRRIQAQKVVNDALGPSGMGYAG